MSKPIEHQQPAVVFSLQYFTAATVANKMSYSGYTKYTERDNATDLSNDVNLVQQRLDQLERDNLAELAPTSQRPDEETVEPVDGVATRLPYQKFIDYTARNTATELDQGDEVAKPKQQQLTPTFDQRTDHLTVAETDQLRQKLDTAQANKGVLWAGVISFSTQYLIDNHLYDPKTEACDQQKIKAAVRHSMGPLLKANGLAEKGFWWGDIQFNTNHIHVHLGISELSPRPDKMGYRNGKRVTKEARRKFTQPSIRKIKSQVFQALIALDRPREREQKLNLEKRLGVQRASLRQQLRQTVGEQQLQALFASLPADKKRWRSRSNARDMAKPKQIASALVNQYLQDNPEFQAFQQTVQALDQYNAVAFGQRTAGRTAHHKEAELRERLTNALFKACRELPDNDQELTIAGLAKNFTAADIEANRQRIDALRQANRLQSTPAKTKELRQRRMALRQQNAEASQAKVEQAQRVLTRLSQEPTSLNAAEREACTFLRGRYQQRLTLAKLKLQAPWEQSPTERQQLQDLTAYFTDVVNVPITQLTSERVAQMQQRLAAEHRLNGGSVVSGVNWSKLRPELQQALSEELGVKLSKPSQMRAQLQAITKQQQELLRLKATLASYKEALPPAVVQQRYQKIERLSAKVKRDQQSTKKAGWGPIEAKTNHWKPRHLKQFQRKQQQASHQILKQEGQQVKQQLRRAEQTHYQDLKAKNALFNQQQAIEQAQQERGR
ncbi:MobP2 family relaxase [Lactiplantibacillus plantarum]|uniref:MobP2 family relaxase n=1 Tax=Lactiplantibacillus plantarum TaxID=1590 RepID=UPI00265A7F49|nr:MobP2 family relaxase [Lactiplantibacillus plantarum]WKF80611.1 MobP2 family relaxase [Lactiplantibacillus plantarum]